MSKRQIKKRKKWIKEQCRRNNHLNTIKKQPIPKHPGDEGYSEQNFQKTRSWPHVWWAENSKRRLPKMRYTYEEWEQHKNFARSTGLKAGACTPCPTHVELSPPSEQTQQREATTTRRVIAVDEQGDRRYFQVPDDSDF